MGQKSFYLYKNNNFLLLKEIKTNLCINFLTIIITFSEWGKNLDITLLRPAINKTNANANQTNARLKITQVGLKIDKPSNWVFFVSDFVILTKQLGCFHPVERLF